LHIFQVVWVITKINACLIEGNMYRDFQRQESRENMNLQAQKYVPDEQAALAILQYLEREQLQQYLNDSSKIDEMIHDLDQV
jgi:hypothetical protein